MKPPIKSQENIATSVKDLWQRCDTQILQYF